MRQLQRIAGAGEVVVVARVVRQQPVIGGVVDAAVAQRRPELVALGGVVVDHVEDHLDAGVVQRADHGAEIVDDVAVAVVRVGREEAERVVAPVIAQAPVDQHAVVEEGVHRQQFDRRDAELAQVRDHAGLGQAAISAAHSLRHVLALLRQAFDVRFVEDRVLPGVLRPPLVGPGVRHVHDHRLVHVAGVVAPVERQVRLLVAGAIAEMRVGPCELAGELLAVGVDQQLVGIEAVAGLRLVGPVHAIAVELARRHVGEINVPDVLGVLRQGDAVGLAPAGAVEQAEIDARRVGGEQREVGAAPVPGRAERVGRAGAHMPARLQERERRQQGVGRQDGAPDCRASQRWKRLRRCRHCCRHRPPHRNSTLPATFPQRARARGSRAIPPA